MRLHAVAANDASPWQPGVAKAAIDKALALDRILAEAYWQRAIVELKQSTVDDALRDMHHALELKSTLLEGYAMIFQWIADIAARDPETQRQYYELLKRA